LEELALIILFCAGYAAIAFEHSLKLHKAATALCTGIALWVILAFTHADPADGLMQSFAGIAAILFFLLGAMVIVELIDTHDGFSLIRNTIHTRSKTRLTWIIAILSFVLSAVLDNLTTSIVMVSMMRKWDFTRDEQLKLGGVIILAANAGGAWSPIGDVTSTMLWIGNQVTAPVLMMKVFLPSLVSCLVPVFFLARSMKGELPAGLDDKNGRVNPSEQKFVLIAGVAALLFVPVFKEVTHLPQFMGMLLSLGVLWLVIEIVFRKRSNTDENYFSVAHALRKIDTPSILFFLGILLAVAALEHAQLLSKLGSALSSYLPDTNAQGMVIGILSAIVDNVPLVAAAQHMYPADVFTTNHPFWLLLCYTAGTGGSLLIIGSAAGVAVMGLQEISFIDYLKKISLYALMGFASGCIVLLVQ
jgi:Na+/H+ antiporter NhaD/arsenite permease-like protein